MWELGMVSCDRCGRIELGVAANPDAPEELTPPWGWASMILWSPDEDPGVRAPKEEPYEFCSPECLAAFVTGVIRDVSTDLEGRPPRPRKLEGKHPS